MNGNNTADRPAEKGRIKKVARTFALVSAILGALLVWIYAIGYDSTLFERTFSGVEVIISGEEELASKNGYTLAEGQKFSSITVVAKGKRSELNELSSSDFQAVVDISSASQAGETTFNIVVYSPNGIEVVSQSSDTVILYVDEFTQRTDMLSVAVDTGSSYIMTEGVAFVEATANPISVLVTGPKSKLDEIEGAYVRFDLDGVEVSDSIYGLGSIELRDKKGNVIDNPYITISERMAYVTVTVTKQKTVPVRVSLTGGVFSAEDITVRTSVESITISGSAGALDAIDELALYIDETAVDGSKTFEFPIAGLLPEGVTNESGISKITATVTLPKMAVRVYTVGVDSIFVKNLPEGAEYTVAESIDISLMGARDAFDTVDRRAITAYVDFDRLRVNDDGSYSAVPTIDLGEDAEGVYVFGEPETVTFIITLPETD